MAYTFRTHNTDRSIDMLEEVVSTSLQHGALILKARLQERAPEFTGRMTRGVQIGEPQRIPDGFSVLVGPDVTYAKYTELEPWIIGKRPGPISQIKGASIPWIRPSVDDTRAEIEQVVQAGIRSGIRQMTSRFRPGS